MRDRNTCNILRLILYTRPPLTHSITMYLLSTVIEINFFTSLFNFPSLSLVKVALGEKWWNLIWDVNESLVILMYFCSISLAI